MGIEKTREKVRGKDKKMERSLMQTFYEVLAVSILSIVYLSTIVICVWAFGIVYIWMMGDLINKEMRMRECRRKWKSKYVR